MPDNNARAERQQRLPIQVIVGNPPWSAGQRSASDDNPNVDYPVLEQRVKETYAEYSTATNKRHLYDTYKMAIRWASDRIKEHGQERGIVAFVTNGSWIDGNVDSGVRACLAQEFNSIYVFHLRGNIHIQMSGGNRAEGDNVFGQKSKTPVAITMLVRNPPVKHDGCQIRYKDIGDYLSRHDKLRALREAKSISGLNDWHTIKPDKHHDWIGQRSEIFTQFYRMGKRNTKVGANDDSIFRLFSLGIATGRDSYIYNFSHNACVNNGRKMVENYSAAMSDLALNPDLSTSEALQRHSSNLKWNRELEKNLQRQKKTKFAQNFVRKTSYRPFVASNLYSDYTFIQMKYQMDRIFPHNSSDNRMICVPGIGLKKPFSALQTNRMTDLNFLEAGSRCFPRYYYPSHETNDMHTLQGIGETLERIDNITDTTLSAFCEHYYDDTITKDAIFDYVYGVLNAPRYREQYANYNYPQKLDSVLRWICCWQNGHVMSHN